MQPDPRYWNGRNVAVVGGTGFLGLHLVRLLHGLGAHVRAFGLPPRHGDMAHVPADVSLFLGDVRDRQLLARAVADCAVVFNVAGFVTCRAEDMEDGHRAAIERVVEMAPADAVIVHTSSIVTVGSSRDRSVLNEDTPFDHSLAGMVYVRAKFASEQAAMAASAKRHVVIVNPAYLIGPEDHDRSFMGQLCQRFWHGRMPMAPPGGFNVVDVRDVALAHLLAAERGRSGQRYIVGGANVTHKEFFARLAAVSGYRPRWLPTAPGTLMTLYAALAETRAWLRGRAPTPSLAEVRVLRRFSYVSSERAVAELGYRPRPLEVSLRDCFRWHVEAGKIRPRGILRWWLRAEPSQAA